MNRRQAMYVLGGALIGFAGCSSPRSTGSKRATGRTSSADSIQVVESASAPRFLDYTDNRADVRVDPEWFRPVGVGAPDTAQAGVSTVRLDVSTRRYPAGEILARGTSRPIDVDETGPVSLSIPLSRETDDATGFAHHVAELRSADDTLDDQVSGTGRIVAETDRFELDGGRDLNPAPHPKTKDAIEMETFERQPAEGHYRILVTGSNARTTTLRVFKSEYVRAASRNRPDGYRPFVAAAIESGLAGRCAAQIVRDTASRGKEDDSNDGSDERVDPTVRAAIDVVQALPYVPEPLDGDADEYVKFPAETLVGGGDCEDSAVLLASILRSAPFGRRCAMIQPPNHMGVGTAGESFVGTYYRRDGTRYFYVETTGQGWEVGELPPEYAEETALVFPV